MARPPVFISHSAHEPEAEGVLESLQAALTDAGFEVLLDRERLRAGELWRKELRRWMDVCRAAVVLVSPAALGSRHVLNETSVLMQRTHRAAQFRCLPVLTGGVEHDSLREGNWEATELAEVETLTWAGHETLKRVLERLAPLLEERSADDPDRVTELRLAERLARLRVGTLRTLGEHLGVALDEWELEVDAPEAVAQRLLESRHPYQLNAVLFLGEVVGSELAEKVYGDVEPYGLVPESAAIAIRRRARGPDRSLGLNSRRTETCELFVHRANLSWHLYDVPADWSEAVLAHVVERVSDEVAINLGYLTSELPVDPKRLNAALVESPMFVVLPDVLQRPDVIDALRSTLGNLVLVVRCESAEQLARAGYRSVEYIVPDLAEGEEDRVHESRVEARRKLRQLAGAC